MFVVLEFLHDVFCALETFDSFPLHPSTSPPPLFSTIVREMRKRMDQGSDSERENGVRLGDLLDW